jgi:hypothetical protein
MEPQLNTDEHRSRSLQKLYEPLDRNARVANNGAKGAGTELPVQGNGDIGSRLVTLQHDMTPALPAAPESAPLQCADAVLA